MKILNYYGYDIRMGKKKYTYICIDTHKMSRSASRVLLTTGKFFF